MQLVHGLHRVNTVVGPRFDGGLYKVDGYVKGPSSTTSRMSTGGFSLERDVERTLLAGLWSPLLGYAMGVVLQLPLALMCIPTVYLIPAIWRTAPPQTTHLCHLCARSAIFRFVRDNAFCVTRVTHGTPRGIGTGMYLAPSTGRSHDKLCMRMKIETCRRLSYPTVERRYYVVSTYCCSVTPGDMHLNTCCAPKRVSFSAAFGTNHCPMARCTRTLCRQQQIIVRVSSRGDEEPSYRTRRLPFPSGRSQRLQNGL